MGFQRFQIILSPEKPIYFAGETVQGYLEVATTEEVSCRNIKVWAKGTCLVRWRRGSGKNRRTYKAQEEYFRQEAVVWDGRETEEKYSTRFRRFPFFFTLPSNIPSSFVSENGKVVYKVKAQADLPYRFDQNTQTLFSVNYLYDLNQDFRAKRRLYMEKDKTVCCLCCAQGPISLSMSAPRAGYVPGENLVVDGEVFNFSSATIKYTEVKLVQVMMLVVVVVMTFLRWK